MYLILQENLKRANFQILCYPNQGFGGPMIKLLLTFRIFKRTVAEVLFDLFCYYVSSYPILLILGGVRRFKRRLKCLWIPRGKGRPPVSNEIIDLILEMRRCNWNWGALRISQELRLLGISISKTTVAQILRENGLIPPRTRMTPMSWSAFYNHHKHLWAVDFTCIFDNKGRQLFIFPILDIASRTLVQINLTANPDRNWIIQQFRNASIQGFDFPPILVADNDAIFGKWLKQDLKDLFDIDVIHIPPKMPWFNPFAERFHLTLKSEFLSRLEMQEVAKVREECILFQEYYNNLRPHQGIGGERPSKNKSNVVSIKQSEKIVFAKKPELNGLVTRFELVA